jgi:hypothetical protein
MESSGIFNLPMKTHVQIQSVNNGYILTVGGRHNDFHTTRDEYVFETFDSLTKWLAENLEDPNNKLPKGHVPLKQS